GSAARRTPRPRPGPRAGGRARRLRGPSLSPCRYRVEGEELPELGGAARELGAGRRVAEGGLDRLHQLVDAPDGDGVGAEAELVERVLDDDLADGAQQVDGLAGELAGERSEEHTSELQ